MNAENEETIIDIDIDIDNLKMQGAGTEQHQIEYGVE